jgi:hypothetical protein
LTVHVVEIAEVFAYLRPPSIVATAVVVSEAEAKAAGAISAAMAAAMAAALAAELVPTV